MQFVLFTAMSCPVTPSRLQGSELKIAIAPPCGTPTSVTRYVDNVVGFTWVRHLQFVPPRLSRLIRFHSIRSVLGIRILTSTVTSPITHDIDASERLNYQKAMKLLGVEDD